MQSFTVPVVPNYPKELFYERKSFLFYKTILNLKNEKSGKKLPDLDAKYQVFFHFVSWVEFIIVFHPPSWKRMTCRSRLELWVDLNTIMQRTANEDAAGLPGICKRSNQPKNRLTRNVTMMQSWYHVESLTGQRHDRVVQTESQELQPWTAVPTLLGLVSAV